MNDGENCNVDETRRADGRALGWSIRARLFKVGKLLRFSAEVSILYI